MCTNIQSVCVSIKDLSPFVFFLEGCEDEERGEASPSAGHPKTRTECWQTQVQKVSCGK